MQMIRGRPINVVSGLELHKNVLSFYEQENLARAIEHWVSLGKRVSVSVESLHLQFCRHCIVLAGRLQPIDGCISQWYLLLMLYVLYHVESCVLLEATVACTAVFSNMPTFVEMGHEASYSKAL